MRQGLKNLREETALKREYSLHGISVTAFAEIKDLGVTDKL